MNSPAGAEVPDALEAEAQQLAERHQGSSVHVRALSSLAAVRELPAWILRASERLEEVPGKVADWFIDNRHVLLRVIAQIEHDLPPAYYGRLPALGLGAASRPRIYDVAHSLAAASSFQLEATTITRFLSAYQRVRELHIGELWALPTMLRLQCLETVVAAVCRSLPSLDRPFEAEGVPRLLADLDEGECIARAIRAVHLIAAISWNDVVERTCVVDGVLSGDPARAYSDMDFETRDRYRKAVEDLAAGAGCSESDAARKAMHLACGAATDEVRSHVGYWLIDEGRFDLERALQLRVPVLRRLSRRAHRHALALYFLAIGFATSAALALPLWYLSVSGAAVSTMVWAAMVVLVPASSVAVAVVHWLITRLLPLRVLPKLDFADGIPETWRTAVVIPALLTDRDTVAELLDHLERHYLANPDPQLVFALLTDYGDATTEHVPANEPLLREAMSGVRRLNERYRSGAAGPFHLLHREGRYNATEQAWMGWERKRGKLEEWNAFLQGEATGFNRHEGDAQQLRDVRFVITLDSDTELVRGSAARLVGTFAHPLNRPRIDETTRRVLSGYTVLQPRIEISPRGSLRSRFARVYAGDTAIDIYSRAVSDVYQDLLGTGVYAGKGIYDVDAFRRCLAGRVPENALLSHDLFEGVHGRVALASDIVLYESFPPDYLSFIERMHRWIRGDWQLVPWLRARVPAADGRRVPTRLTALGRWMIFDNLRRSLLSPTLLALLVAGWLVLPGDALVWTLFAAAAPATHWLCNAFVELWRWRPPAARRRARVDFAPRMSPDVARVGFFLTFLPYEAAATLDAIVRTLVRLTITHKHLLQWMTAAQTAAGTPERETRATTWRAMVPAPAAALLVCALLAWLRPAGLATALPLLVLWLVSPEIAYEISRPPRSRVERLKPEQQRFVRRVARRTWLFFETFVGPEDHWLPPDNHQETPVGETDHRTSPTNIGMLLLSTLSAWDLGYLGPRGVSARLDATLSRVRQLERYRGHLLNWYDTRTLDALAPRYVSTVDSGNLSAALTVVSTGCEDILRGPVLSSARWDGLMDCLGLFEEALADLGVSGRRGDIESLVRHAAEIRRRAAAVRETVDAWSSTLFDLCEHDCVEFDREVAETIEAYKASVSLPVLHELRIWLERAHKQLRAMRADVELLLGWLPILDAPPQNGDGGSADAGPVIARLREVLSPLLPLADIPAACTRARTRLSEASAGLQPSAREVLEPWLSRLDASLSSSGEHAAALAEQLRRVGRSAQTEALAPDFRFLYDAQRQLFHIGYNLAADTLDAFHYGLFASECRLASYVAIAKGDVPVKHWLYLGRPMTRLGRSVALLSWGGTLFEYLMPRLLLRSGDDLAGLSDQAAVEVHRAFARQHGVPWGISESAYADVDGEQKYQYRAFGVPGLGLRSDSGEDLVVAPYASALAVAVQPAAAVSNLMELASYGALGEFGFRDALDFTPVRVPHGRTCAVVATYMAHHQGMLLAALANHVTGSRLVRRFHANARMKTAEMLLHERLPSEISIEFPAAQRPLLKRTQVPQGLPTWAPARRGAFPEVHAFGNGRMSTLITDSGSGGLRWVGRALTRWNPDPTLDDSGVWTYVRDLDNGQCWSVGRQPTGAAAEEYEILFHGHMAEVRRRDEGIAIRLEVGIAPGDDVEVRRITVVNESGRPRRLAFTSYGEVVLASPEDDRQHPAFSKLFVRGEHLPQLDALLFERRPRRPGEREPLLAHRLVAESRNVRCTRVEMSRARFLGRDGSVRRPRLVSAGEPDASAGLDTDLDPVMSIEATVDLPPDATEHLGFVTIVGASRAALIRTAVRYGSAAALEWALADAAGEAAREAAQLELDPGRMHLHQRLLSLVVQLHPALRAVPPAAEHQACSQRDLWSMGLSGDVPIVLLRSTDPTRTELLRELVGVHRAWSRRGVRADLVVLDLAATGYEDWVARELHDCLSRFHTMSALHRRGGVHLIRADRAGDAHVGLLHAVAHVVLDGGKPLEQQLRDVHHQPEALPHFVPHEHMLPPPAGVPVQKRGDLVFDNGVGGFSNDGREYVVRLAGGATTPAPWCNILANARFGTLVSERGGGYTWAVNSAERRLTRWCNDPVCDGPSEALYLRDEQTAAVWMPAVPGADATVEIAHRAGCTTWRRTDQGFEQNVEVFVALDEAVKIVRIRLRDTLGHPRRVTATYYVEWVLGRTREQCGPLLTSSYDAGARALLARNPWNPVFAERVAFLASNREPHGFTTDRCEFLGREGDVQRPAALTRWGLRSDLGVRSDPCGVLQIHLDVPAGAEEEACFFVGDAENRDEALAVIERWRAPRKAATAAVEVDDHWQRLLGALEVRTPDPAFDVMINRWLIYQAVSSRLLARTGYYQSSGAFGFRDQLQDVMALIHCDPRVAREQILTCARHQFEEGDVLHWWHPPEDRGVRTHCSDDLLWLPFVTAHYVESTGDDAILDEKVAFLVGPQLGRGEHDHYALFARKSEAALFEHCARALKRGLTRGAHGLPLIGTGDWNDGMSRVGERGRGESVWLAWFTIAACLSFAEVASRRGVTTLADELRRQARALATAAEKEGWDGAWYRRAFDDDGRPWGSSSCEECRIDSIAQSWAVLSGAADPARAHKALESAVRQLVRPADGVACLLWPPFDKTPRDPGYIKAYPPGVRENGGQYSHAAAWLAWAFALVGDAERAQQVLRLLNPIEHARTAEAAARYRVEPYVLAADIFSVAPHVGRGGWTWYTGSAAWTYRVGVEAVLGLTLVRGRLKIDPCVPAAWRGFQATLRTAGGTVEIDVQNPDGVTRGVEEVAVDGTKIKGDVVELPVGGRTCRVQVRLGAPSERRAHG